jgi:AraC-like DNA-binding protein
MTATIEGDKSSAVKEFIEGVNSWEGQGYELEIEVHPHLWLYLADIEYHHEFYEKTLEGEHPVQFTVFLSGKCFDEFGGQIGEGHTMISGGGMQRSMLVKNPKCREISINIEMSPELLKTFFPAEDGDIAPELKFLTKGNDWQTLLYPKTTTAIQIVAQQIFNCPYKGITRRMYLQGKIQELMALQLAPILTEQDGMQPYPRLKAQTIARIHRAEKILLSRLENPPSLIELAQLVGVSHRTLKRGFRELFNTTVFGYLNERRMERAAQFLQEGKQSVAEVGNLVGYSHQGHFAAKFKDKFGITPSQCLSGKKFLTEL